MEVDRGNIILTPMPTEIPMPEDEAELDQKFSELVDELDMDKARRAAMFALPPEKKWQIYCANRQSPKEVAGAEQVEFYLEKVRIVGRMGVLFTENDITERAKDINNLKTALQTQTVSFVVSFIENGGIQTLLDTLGNMNMDGPIARSKIHLALINCVKALMNSTKGSSHILAHADATNIVAQSLRCDNPKVKISVLELFGAMCMIPGGHKKVLQAFVHFQNYAGERTRFQSLIVELDRSSGMDNEEEELVKTAIMSFINAAIKSGAGQNNLEFRLHLRYEFLMLGIQPVIEKLDRLQNPNLHRHLEFFEMIRNEDEKEMAKRFEVERVNSKSAMAMFELLRKKTNHALSFQHLMSILQHLLLMPFGNTSCGQWQLIDRIVQQIVLQNKEGDPDIQMGEFDVKKLVKQIANENEIKDYQQKIREAQKETEQTNVKLQKKEKEIETLAVEKDELINTVNSMKTKLEKEKRSHEEAKAEILTLSHQLRELQELINLEHEERMKLQQTESLSDDAKVVISKSAPKIPGLDSDISSSIPRAPVIPGFAPPPPPPPPPPGMGAPAPPPPPAFGQMGGGGGGISQKKKNIPPSTNPMKSFNWTKLPDHKITGTLWSGIDESKMYRILALDDFEKVFSAYQRSISDADVLEKKQPGNEPKVKVLSVIDGRRAQNCTILLSKLKMTNKEVTYAVNNMDPHSELPKDMCEQLLKFVPTPEEIQMLSEYGGEVEHMAKADRFLYDMSKIDRYEQKLNALVFKKKFSERMGDCKPKIEGVLRASEEVMTSRKLKKVLEIVLAFGNYMNNGNRSNASGFKISSLNKIIDTKSSSDTKITLLHYLLEVVEKQFPELLNLNEDLKNVNKAGTVVMKELEVEINQLRKGLKEIEKEIEFHKNRTDSGSNGSKLVSELSNFYNPASYNFSEMEETFKESKEKFEKAAKFYGEDPNTTAVEEFFAVFDQFLTSFMHAHTDNKRFREEEKRRAQMELLAEQRRKSKSKISHDNHKTDFDGIISSVMTLEAFGDDMAKASRRKPQRVRKEKISFDRERSGNSKI